MELTGSLDDSNDRAGRYLMFYENTDSERVNWTKSEEIIINHWKYVLNVTFSARDTDRAHRLGSF